MATVVDQAVAVVRDRLGGERECINGADPDALFVFPQAWDEDEEYRNAPELETIGRLLVYGLPELAHLQGVDVRYLWKRHGTKQGGKPVLGTCQKPGGVLAFFSGADFVVWLSCEHLVAIKATNWQVEAVLHHELSHAGWDDEKDRPTVQGHDFADFKGTVGRYGFYLDDLVEAEDCFRQARFDWGRR